MDTNEIRLWFSVAQWIITCIIGFYVWITKRDAAKQAEVEAIRSRLVTLEEQIRHVPDQASVHSLHADMKAVTARLEGIQQSIAPLAGALDRINTYLLNNK